MNRVLWAAVMNAMETGRDYMALENGTVVCVDMGDRDCLYTVERMYDVTECVWSRKEPV